MSGPLLTSVGRKAIEQASEMSIIEAAGRIRRYLPFGRLLGTNNRYGRDAAGRVSFDKRQNPPNPVNSKHLAELLAASVPIHCIDGWGLLSGAVGAHMDGNPDGARHLAYYAELRASLAILGSQGIGVFNSPHYAIDHVGIAHEIKFSSPARTHHAVWTCLAEWSQLSHSAAPIADVVRPEGTRIDEWLRLFAGGAQPWKPLAGEWIGTLGVDIRMLAQDRDARNAASYRPTSLYSRDHLSVASAVAYTTTMWRTLGSTARSFDQIDLHFLRSSLQRWAESSRTSGADFDAAIMRVLDVVGVSSARKPVLGAFLSAPSGGTHDVVDMARKKDRESATTHHIQVISRALILLRLSTGLAKRMLEKADIRPAEYEFWWSSIAASRGLYEGAGSLEDFEFAWADVTAAIEDLEAWLEGDVEKSYFTLRMTQGQAVRHARSLELAGLQELIS